MILRLRTYRREGVFSEVRGVLFEDENHLVFIFESIVKIEQFRVVQLVHDVHLLNWNAHKHKQQQNDDVMRV